MSADFSAPYKPITQLFDDLDLRGGTQESVIEKPYHFESLGDEIYIFVQDLLKMPDGKQIELCRWRIDDLNLWDVSAPKEQFPSQDAFEDYLRGMNFPLENTVDLWNDKWAYVGKIEKDDVWRVQYFYVEEWD